MNGARFLTPRRGLSWDDIGTAIEGMGGRKVDPADPDTLFEWALAGSTVRLCEDGHLRLEQLVITGDHRDATADELANRLPVYSVADVPGLFEAAAGPVERCHAVSVLAAVAPPTTDAVALSLFRRAFADTDATVRGAALVGATVPGWPELRADVERLTKDEDEDVCELAAGVLPVFERT
jgi:hypothetical protein